MAHKDVKELELMLEHKEKELVEQRKTVEEFKVYNSVFNIRVIPGQMYQKNPNCLRILSNLVYKWYTISS